MKKQGFSTRSFVSILTFAGFVIMGITGIVLFVAPAGRIAYWTNWTLLGLTKTQWGNIHIIGGIVFVAFGIVHTWLNWKPLKGYLTKRFRPGAWGSQELLAAGAIALIIVVGASLEIPPLDSFLRFNTTVKDSWIADEAHEPPFGHAEMLSLKGFVKKVDMDLDAAVDALQANGIRIASVEDSLEKIARDNKTSPMEIYRIMKPREQSRGGVVDTVYTADLVEEKFAGTGIGQKTLKQACTQLGIDISTARSRLARKGIEMGDSEKIKDGAARHAMNPLDLMKIIAVE